MKTNKLQLKILNYEKVNVQPCFVLDSFGKRFITTDGFYTEIFFTSKRMAVSGKHFK